MIGFGNEAMAGRAQGARGISGLWTLLPALVVLLIGGAVQGLTFLNHDVAWVLNSSERLLHGGTFGQDIVAANPPLIWWISALVAGLAELIGVSPETTLRVVVLLIAAGVLALVERALAPRMGHVARAGFLLMLALLVTLGVHRDFAQREHLAVLLCLPWLLVAARRIEGEDVGPWGAALAGIAAGIGIAFKPHFLAVPALVWLCQALKARSLRPALRIETATLLITGLAYIGAVWLFARPWLTEVLPLISALYWGFSYPILAVLQGKIVVTGIVLVALLGAAGGRWPALASVMAMAGLGFFIAALAQSKGYSYHFYPALTFALIALMLTVLTDSPRAARLGAGIALGLGLAFVAAQARPTLTDRSMAGAYGQRTQCLVDLVQAHAAPGEGFMAISTHPDPGFPIANYSERRWVAETNSRLFLPAIARLRASAALTPDEARQLELAEATEHAAMGRDMGQAPAVVLVDARPDRHAIGPLEMDFVAFYREDPAFDRIWSGYTEIPSCAPGIRAFALNKDR